MVVVSDIPNVFSSSVRNFHFYNSRLVDHFVSLLPFNLTCSLMSGPSRAPQIFPSPVTPNRPLPPILNSNVLTYPSEPLDQRPIGEAVAGIEPPFRVADYTTSFSRFLDINLPQEMLKQGDSSTVSDCRAVNGKQCCPPA